MKIMSNNFVRTDQMENRFVISLPSSSEPGLAATGNVWLASLAVNERRNKGLREDKGPQTLRSVWGPLLGKQTKSKHE
jgi:hypothetical protein